MKLYEMTQSPSCQRVRIALAEKELDYQSVSINLMEGENRSEQFLRLNPLGKVPVLVDEGLILAESLVINEYLDEEYPYPVLRPEDPQARALVRLWSAQIDAMVFAPWYQLFLSDRAREKGESIEAEKEEKAKATIQQFFVHAGRALKNKDYLVETYSLADIAFAPMIYKLEKIKIAAPAELPQVAAWMKRLAAKPTIAAIKG